jgi:hypothetical protein
MFLEEEEEIKLPLDEHHFSGVIATDDLRMVFNLLVSQDS